MLNAMLESLRSAFRAAGTHFFPCKKQAPFRPGGGPMKLCIRFGLAAVWMVPAAPANAGVVSFDPGMHLATAGDLLEFNVYVASMACCAGFDDMEMVIGSNFLNITGFTYSQEFEDATANFFPAPIVIYQHDVYLGGFAIDEPLATPFLIGTVTVDTTGLSPGSYLLVVDSDFDNGTSFASLLGDSEGLFGSAEVVILGEPECGNNVIEEFEECDGDDDGECPGMCHPPGIEVACLCGLCGDEYINAGEECDGPDDAACPGACQKDCTCAFDDCNENGIDDADDIGPFATGRKVYWTDWVSPNIGRMNLDGTSAQNLISGQGSPWDIALDPVAGKLYFTRFSPTPLIQRANLDGSGLETLVSTDIDFPLGLDLDLPAGKMYWVDNGGSPRIRRANLNGTGPETLISTGLSGPVALRLDVPGGKMYWTEVSDPTIKRANLDGSGIETLVSSDLSAPQGLSLDLVARRMYWTEHSAGIVKSADLDGTNVQTLISSGLDLPEGIAVDAAGGRMYWVELGAAGAKIRRARTDGTFIETLANVTDPIGIALDLTSADCNGNGIPDECDILDCPERVCIGGPLNGIACTVDSDCAAGFVCVANPHCQDCNFNGRPDSCDIADGISLDTSPADGRPDDCHTFTGLCDEPGTEDQWTCFENWDLSGAYPDDEDSAASVEVEIPAGADVFLDETVVIPSLHIKGGPTDFDPKATLRITQADPLDPGRGDLQFSAPGVLRLEGAMLVAGARKVAEPNEALGRKDLDPLLVMANGIYQKDPNAIPSTTAQLFARGVYIWGGSNPLASGGQVVLTDGMQFHVAGHLELERYPSAYSPGALPRGGISPPPKLLLSDISTVSVGGDIALEGEVETTNTSAEEVVLSGNFDNKSTRPSLFDWTAGTLRAGGSEKQRFEVAGLELGPTTEGFGTDLDTLTDTDPHTNYSLGTLLIASTTDMTFANDTANTAGDGDCQEALYVKNLIFESGAVVTIDNCRVYYIDHQPNGVTPDLLGCGQLVQITDGVFPLRAATGEAPKPRFLSFTVPPAAGPPPPAPTAIRIEMEWLHHPASPPPNTPDFKQWENRNRYVNSLGLACAGGPNNGNACVANSDCPPPGICLRHVCADSSGLGTYFRCATIGCSPEYRNWAEELGGAMLHVTGAELIPDSIYHAALLPIDCGGDELTCIRATPALTGKTSRWGDVVGGSNGPPDGIANVLDISATVDKVKDLPTAFAEPRMWLKDNLPDPKLAGINVLDISNVVDAVKGFAYPFAGPDSCTGACCSPPPLACQDDLTQLQCETMGGIYQGDGSDCPTVSCP